MQIIEAALWFIAGAVVSGIIQLIVAVVFEQTTRKYYRRFRRRLVLISTALRANKLNVERDLYRIGKVEANVIILEGTPSEPYAPDKINCYIDTKPLILPDELQVLRDQVELDQQIIREVKGKEDFHNGAMVAFLDYQYGYTSVLEEPTLLLKFRKTDYYTFLATSLKIDEPVLGSSPAETLRSKYIGLESYRHPNPYFAASFGVNICAVTSDNYVIVGKRSDSGVSHYHGLYAVPIMESVNPEKDRDVNAQLDVYETARRGTREELGVEVDRQDVKFFTLQVDVRYYLYGLTGLIMLQDYGREDLRALMSRGIRDRWENTQLIFVPFNPRAFADYVNSVGGVGQFHPAAFVAIVQSLINEYGQRQVISAFK